ncbi:hypothetical protein [Paenibacillus sedimenti]|uniref:Tissue inhibitor of metalloproteinase n=1 Tax=Paenibacillus sedimenti TaxID=2770274 RepID=A0A926QNH6_9BACL|nr:hypothetical protein [Paenibacillus sedimenti]MBD0384792.1 hypothetical protein [Paenibacillus sedimenti]
MKKLIVIVMLAMIVFLLNTVPKAEALSCAPPQPANQEMERSSVVFKGRAIDIKSGGLTVFQVEKAWKGIEGPIIEIYDNGWDPYTKSTDYLVFGSKRDGKLRTNLCGRTGPWDTAQEEAMKEIKPEPTVFKEVIAESSKQFNPQTWPVIMAILLFLIILLFIFSVVWIRKKRRTDI